MLKKLRKVIICFLLLSLPFFLFSQQNNSSIKLEKVDVFSCGKQPKQVLFSPDGENIVLPLLDDYGFQVIKINNEKGETPVFISPQNSKEKGFVEGLFIPEKKAFFISQMTTGSIYEYEYPGFTYRRTISTDGIWSKFIAWSNEKQIIAVSNWVSNDVSLIDYSTGKILRKLKTGAAPRGIIFLNEGNEILVLCFDGGEIQKFRTSDGVKISECKVDKAAMRHVVLNSQETIAYISDMYHFRVYEFNLNSFSIVKTWKVYNNPNTIALLNDTFLFVSSRGPNNPEDYTLRSPKNGEITIIDTTIGKVVNKIEGGNQPTGLAISPDGKYLCFSNFQDANIELYRINITQQ